MTEAQDRIRIHIDTDPGLDDLLALGLALGSPELDIVGITTVAGNASLETVSDNARRFLALAGCRTALGQGAAGPRALELQDATAYHGLDGRAGVSIPALDRQPLPDASFVLEESVRIRHASVILALGPLTNLAAQLDDDPEIFSGTELIWMGGTLGEGNATRLAEFNAYADPAAVERVLEAGVSLRVVGLDVTGDTYLLPRQLPDDRFGSSAMGRLFWNILNAQMDAEEPVHGYRRATLHDPCALLATLPEDLFRWEPKHLEIHVGEGSERGRMREGNQRGAPARYASEVDRERVATLFLERLARYAASFAG